MTIIPFPQQRVLGRRHPGDFNGIRSKQLDRRGGDERTGRPVGRRRVSMGATKE